MKIENVTFDNFYKLNKKDQDEILNDPELLFELLKKNNISSHRITHSLGVAKTCQMLAKCHNYDPKKAYIAGLLHDCCKFKDSDTSGELEKILSKYEPERLNEFFGAYHSWAAYYYLKEKLNFKDEEVLNAIYNHTFLTSKDTLSLILFIADKREPNRKIDDDIIDIAKKDLSLAYDKLIINIKNYLKENGKEFIEPVL